MRAAMAFFSESKTCLCSQKTWQCVQKHLKHGRRGKISDVWNEIGKPRYFFSPFDNLFTDAALNSKSAIYFHNETKPWPKWREIRGWWSATTAAATFHSIRQNLVAQQHWKNTTGHLRVKIGKPTAHTNGDFGCVVNNHEVVVQSCQNTRAEINKASHQKWKCLMHRHHPPQSAIIRSCREKTPFHAPTTWPNCRACHFNFVKNGYLWSESKINLDK